MDLKPGENLKRGETLYSPNREYKLVFQDTDGNLVWRDKNNKALWHANIPDKDAQILKMQSDGNLVIYDSHSRDIKSWVTQNISGTWLNCQDDGNLVLYCNREGKLQALWSSMFGYTAIYRYERGEQNWQEFLKDKSEYVDVGDGYNYVQWKNIHPYCEIMLKPTITLGAVSTPLEGKIIKPNSSEKWKLNRGDKPSITAIMGSFA